LLSSQGIAYVNGEVAHDQAARDALVARGMKSVPVTIWNDHVVIGVNPKALARVFNLRGAVAVVAVPTMLEQSEIVLNATCRAFRQWPADRWDWESPERKRTLGQLCFHLADRPDRALHASRVGVYANEDRGRAGQHVLGAVGFAAVARKVEEVLRRVQEALRGPPVLTLDNRLETDMGDKTAGAMMDLA
jgi:hypothetical protein